jgi:L-asparaginase
MGVGEKPRILLLYTGGTIGMIHDPETSVLVPFNVDGLLDAMPELAQLDVELEVDSLDKPIDSSNINPMHWVRLAKVIKDNYNRYDGVVILHGSDTMAYTASALSFMLEGLAKPVILTGSQLPVGVPRSDGRENLISAIEIAAHKTNGLATVPEVCIYFEYSLYRGNRAHKFNSENFEAFLSVNYPVLAKAGVNIRFNEDAIDRSRVKSELTVHEGLDNSVASIRLFPGLNPAVSLNPDNFRGVKGLVLETYGSGNAPTDSAFLSAVKEISQNGTIILNITQCKGGRVNMGKYATSAKLADAGVISGHDMTMEAGFAKLMFLFGSGADTDTIKELLERPLRGEMSLN